jgi:enediyne biosynthesis protein E4
VQPRRLLWVGGAALIAAVVVGGALATGLVRWPRDGTDGTEATAGPAPRFVDDTAGSGVDFTYDGPFEYAVGAGVAVFDCNDDGRQDLYLAGGEGPAALFQNDSHVGDELRFIRLADQATDLTAVNGAYPIDVDSDGVTDLITLRWGENVALRGLGDCRFERANEAWGIDGGAEMTEAFSATWEAGEELPTLAFGNYLEPDNFDLDTRCQTNELLRPASTGAVYGPPIPLAPGYCALSVLFSDWDGSGRRDLRISNDRAYYRQTVGQEQLWRIEPGEAPRLYTADEGWARTQVQGMGIASYDVTGDGLPEVYLTSQAANKLQTLAEGPDRPTFRDIGLQYGVNVAQPFTGSDTNLPSTAWHPEFDDVNNDGLVDLYVSKGNVTEEPEFAMEDPSNLLLGQPEGPFREVADVAGIVRFDRGRGAALVDFNIDGRLDLIQSSYGAPVRLWRNVGPVEGSDEGTANWIALRIRQPAPNIDAIGAIVEVRAGGTTWRRELTVGGGHAGGELGWVHFGLGAESAAEVRVTWPGGEVGPWRPVPLGFAYVDHPGVVRASDVLPPDAEPEAEPEAEP